MRLFRKIGNPAKVLNTILAYTSGMDTKLPKQKAKSFLENHQQDFMVLQNNCALCGTELTIKVETYLEDYYLLEKADCPSCNIKAREKNHRMH